MSTSEKITFIKNYVKTQLSEDISGHDYWHIERVVTNAQKILLHETADNLKVLVAAWLHDIGDYKLHNGIDKTEELVYPLLSSLEFKENFIIEIIKIISEVSYNGGYSSTPSTLEAKIVQDADRLDAIGAIGIARAFTYGGSKGRKIFNPKEKFVDHIDAHSYKKILPVLLIIFMKSF